MRFFLITCLLFVNANNCISQTKPEQIPLLKFLQENFDSTVVYSPPVWTREEIHLWIVSEKENVFTYFIYHNPYQVYSMKIYPQSLKDKFFKPYTEYRKILPDTNRYFFPFYVGYQKIKEPWATILLNDCWNLKDDSTDEKCDARKNYLIDGSSNIFYLITKKEIKTLIFIAPELDEQYCKTSESRKKVLQIVQSFKAVFNKQR